MEIEGMAMICIKECYLSHFFYLIIFVTLQLHIAYCRFVLMHIYASPYGFLADPICIPETRRACTGGTNELRKGESKIELNY